MKTLKTLFAALILFGFTMNASAQTTLDAEQEAIDARAEILTPLSINELASLDFGVVFSNDGNAVLNPALFDGEGEGVENAGRGDDSPTVAELAIAGSNGAEITVTVPEQISMSHVGTGSVDVGTFDITTMASYNNEENDVDASTELNSNGDDIFLNNNGDAWVYVGGQFNPSDLEGVYEGSFNVTVDYTNF